MRMASDRSPAVSSSRDSQVTNFMERLRVSNSAFRQPLDNRPPSASVTYRRVKSADAILHILFNLNIVYDFARFQTMPGFVHQLNISGL